MKDIIEFNGITFVRYPESKYRTSRVYYLPYIGSKRAKGVGTLHQEVWKAAHGPIPAGCDIHHKDENPLNNSLDNLECLTKKEHSAKHAEKYREQRREHVARIRVKASEWHGSEEGLAFHRELGKKAWEGKEAKEHVCQLCGKTFLSRSNKGSRFCSQPCRSKAYLMFSAVKDKRSCVICGKAYETMKANNRKTCSEECSSTLRSRSKRSQPRR